MNPIWTKVIVDAVTNSMKKCPHCKKTAAYPHRFPARRIDLLIGRDDSFIVAKGGTVIQPGDRLLILAGKQDLAETRHVLEESQAEQKGGDT